MCVYNCMLFRSVCFSLSITLTLQHVCVRLRWIMDWIQICSLHFITECHGWSTTRTCTRPAKQKPRRYADTHCDLHRLHFYKLFYRFLFWFNIICHLQYHAVIITQHLNLNSVSRSSAGWKNVGQVRSYLRTLL